MKAITITVPEELDARAAAEARRRGISKSELVREGLAAVLPDSHSQQDDENIWIKLAGFGPPGVTISPEDIDAVIYDL